MSKHNFFYKNFNVVQRHDGSWAAYDYAWWPDEYLDSDPEANERWLEATGGWRAKGWQVIYVGRTRGEVFHFLRGF